MDINFSKTIRVKIYNLSDILTAQALNKIYSPNNILDINGIKQEILTTITSTLIDCSTN